MSVWICLAIPVGLIALWFLGWVVIAWIGEKLSR